MRFQTSTTLTNPWFRFVDLVFVFCIHEMECVSDSLPCDPATVPLTSSLRAPLVPCFLSLSSFSFRLFPSPFSTSTHLIRSHYWYSNVPSFSFAEKPCGFFELPQCFKVSPPKTETEKLDFFLKNWAIGAIGLSTTLLPFSESGTSFSCFASLRPTPKRELYSFTHILFLSYLIFLFLSFFFMCFKLRGLNPGSPISKKVVWFPPISCWLVLAAKCIKMELVEMGSLVLRPLTVNQKKKKKR